MDKDKDENKDKDKEEDEGEYEYEEDEEITPGKYIGLTCPNCRGLVSPKPEWHYWILLRRRRCRLLRFVVVARLAPLFFFLPLLPQHIYSSHHSYSGSTPPWLPYHLSPPSSPSSASFLLLLFLTNALGRSCDQGLGLHLLSISDFSDLIFLFLFTLIVLHFLLRSDPITTLRSSFYALITLSAPLFLLRSSPIFLIHSDPPRFFSLASTLFLSNLICLFPSYLTFLLFLLLNSYCSYHALL